MFKIEEKCVFCGENVEIGKDCYSSSCVAVSEDREVEEMRQEIRELEYKS